MICRWCSMSLMSPLRNFSNQNRIHSRVRTGFFSSSSRMLVFRASFRASSSSSRCLVVGVRIPCSMASRRFASRFSVSRSWSFRTGRRVFSCCWASIIKSISRSMISLLKITLMAVSTTNRSNGSLRMAFRSQCALPWRLALPHL